MASSGFLTTVRNGGTTASEQAMAQVAAKRSVHELSVDLAPVPNLHNRHCLLRVGDGIDNPVRSLPYSVAFLCGEFFASHRPRGATEACDLAGDASPVFSGNSLKLFCGRRLDENSIASHVASSLSGRLRRQGWAHGPAPQTLLSLPHLRSGFASPHR